MAMRVARAGRSTASPWELVQETWTVLTSHREELESLRASMSQGEDKSEAWYVTSPVFSRLVTTHFQDKALAIGYTLSSKEAELIRSIEIERVWATLPNPLLRILDIQVDKNEVNSYAMGAWMESFSGMKEESRTGNFSAGGFIGDGYAAFGWGYLLPFGGVALVLFIFGDSLYLITETRTLNGRPGGTLAVVGLIYGCTLTTCLANESIAGLISYVIRQPLQWLVLYGVIFGVIHWIFRAFGGSSPSHQLTASQRMANPIKKS
jgi:hypothetical protein